jgi:hypothetical protein
LKKTKRGVYAASTSNTKVDMNVSAFLAVLRRREVEVLDQADHFPVRRILNQRDRNEGVERVFLKSLVAGKTQLKKSLSRQRFVF